VEVDRRPLELRLERAAAEELPLGGGIGARADPAGRATQMLRAAIESPEGEITAVYGRVDEAKAEYDVLRKTAAESKVALGKVAAVQA